MAVTLTRAVAPSPVTDARLAPDDGPGHRRRGAGGRDRLGHPALALVWLPWAALCRGRARGGGVLVRRIGRIRGKPRARRALGLGRAAGVAAGVLVAGWRGARWWRRGVSALAVPLCLLCCRAGVEPVGRLLPHRADRMEPAHRGPAARSDGSGDGGGDAETPRRFPPKARSCRSASPTPASGFKHRGELVYLPPAWYATDPPPRLPTVMMVGGEFNTPADWMRAGNAVKTIDDFAAAHGGNAPVFVFVDSGRRFQQRHRMRQRHPRQRRRSPHQRCCTVHDFELRRERPTAPAGASLDGRWAAHARST